MTAQVWFVTGASRGIGLAMVKQLLTLGHTVIGACRNPDGARDLWELQGDYKSRFKLVKLDLNEPSTVDAVAAQFKGQTVDVLVNNAGVLLGKDGGFADVKLDEITKSFEVNTLGPMRVTRALLPCLQKSASPKVVNISSVMGSMADNKSGGYYAYRMSKIALNMFNGCFAIEFPKITSLAIHPGWVQTAMGGEQAPTSVYDSAKGIIETVGAAKPKDSGQFLDFAGVSRPW
jgi:NAD(P)-dependent dehydrogenase (short-subunit alcohol dehydrogenase family)